MSYLVKKGLMMQGGAASTLLTGLISYWKLDDLAGNAVDSLGLNDGTVVGCTQGVAGKIGTAYSFDGNDYINIDNLINDINSNTTGSISLWIKPTDKTANESLFGLGDTDGGSYFNIRMQTSAAPVYYLRVYFRIGSTFQWTIEVSDDVLTNGTWSHILLVQDGVDPILYVDGSKPSQGHFTSIDITKWITDIPLIDNGRIGSLNLNNAGEIRYFNGSIDEVGVWSRALTSDERTELYNGGSGLSYPF